MVKRNPENPLRDADKRQSTNSGRGFSRESIKTSKSVTDELIHSLSAAYENQRARQVGEWERFQASSAPHAA